MNTFSTNYRVVDVNENEELPDELYWMDKTRQWLNPVPDSIILTREEFEKMRREIASDAFEVGWKNGHADGAQIEEYVQYPDKQQYLDSLSK